MNSMAIPREKALQLCTEIRQENRHKRYTPAGMMCWGCTTFSKGDPAKMCFSSRPDFRGCYQVNARYDSQVKSGAVHEDERKS
jgi:hypothetical protein